MSTVLREQSFFALNKAYAIRFPRIQRDFAQGRTRNAKAAAVRADFVRDLCGSLKSGGASVKMDFIYGEVSCLDSGDRAFLPLDGQQRLTTLFLLHWLLSPAPLSQTLKGITYESRRAAMAFCERLQKCAAQAVMASAGESVSAAIKRQPWFRSVWSRDQTVRGMLVMLDALQNQLRTLPAGPDYWGKLCDMQMFRCLQTNGLTANDAGDSLTDRIYLKMNARGLALTPFEIIKSQIVTFLGDDLQLAPGWSMSAKEVKDNLDQQWLKFFFRNCGDKFDAAMTRFIALQVYFVSLSRAPDKNKATQEREKWEENHTQLYRISDDPFSFSSFAPFSKVLASTPDETTGVALPDARALVPLFRILNILSSGTGTYVKANYKEKTNRVAPTQVDQPSWFMDAIIPSWDKTDQGTFYSYDFLCPSNYAQRTVVYAASVFPFSAALPSEDEQRRFKEWMRVCWNLIQNSTVTSENKTAEDAVSLIRQFSPHATDIHAYLQAFPIPSQIYAKDQLIEEKTKIEWFSNPAKGVSYGQMIDAESHPLLRGRINVLLESPDTFAPRHARFVQLMKQNSDEVQREKAANATPSHTLQKALVTKIETQALHKKAPLPPSNTAPSWMAIIATHEAAVRRLLADPAEPADMLHAQPSELWKRRMLQDTALWERGKPNRKGLVLIDGRVYLYTNPTNMTSAIPLDTSIPELWRKLFNRPDTAYPDLNDGNTISVATDSCSQLNSLFTEGPNRIDTARMYFYPNQLIIRLWQAGTSRDVTVFSPYPPVDAIAARTAESLWQEISSKCLPPVPPPSDPAAAPVPAPAH